jgi:hypothetical protein
MVDISVEPLNAKSPPRPPAIPVAGFSHFSGEVYMIQRAKLRPAIVVSVEAPSAALPKGSPSWQALPMVYVAPAYGCDQDGSRAGWDKTFTDRIKMCMYPQYMLEKLPLAGPEWSVVRFDQIQPISRRHDSFILTEHCLSQEAVQVVNDWVSWAYTGEVTPNGAIDMWHAEMVRLQQEATKRS